MSFEEIKKQIKYYYRIYIILLSFSISFLSIIMKDLVASIISVVLDSVNFIVKHVNYLRRFIGKYLNDLENHFFTKFSNFKHDMFKDDMIIKQNKTLIYAEVVNLLNRRQKGKFYAPSASFWPLFLTAALSLFLMFMTIFLQSSKFFNYINILTIISLVAIGVAVSFWFSIFFIEKRKGNHVAEIRRNIELGFYLFLFTEALCFIALFWVFLHSFLAASLHIGIYNPGEGIANLYINEFVTINENWNLHYFKSVGTPHYFKISTLYTMADVDLYKTKDIKLHVNFYDSGQLVNPYKLPLLNTLILLTSAACLNISHVSLRISRYLKSFFWLFVTIFLGLFFVYVQYTEYKACTFQYNDGIYAACFFSLTGLHGIHVMIGITALIVCAINILFKNYSPNFHQSYKYSIFYWHFVDVVWILVYFVMYLWPAYFFHVDEFYTTYKHFFTANFSKNYFNTIIDYNAFIDYKTNTKTFYASFCSGLGLKGYKLVASFDHTDFENFYIPSRRKIVSSMKKLKYMNLVNTIHNNEYSSEEYMIYAVNKCDNNIDSFKLSYEILQQQLVKGKNFINYNEVKKDPMLYCFVLNQMHDDLISCVQDAHIIDMDTKYKRYMIHLFFKKTGLTPLSRLWCYFFLPYVYSNDASIRFRF